MEYNVVLEECNKEALVMGLESVGVNFEDLTEKEIGAMLTYALGFVDYTDEVIVEQMLENR